MAAAVRAMSGITLAPALATLLLGPALAAEAPLHVTFRDMSLPQALAVFERRGLSIIYSSDLVKPWMRVRTEPTTDEPQQALGELLEPFGLRLRVVPNAYAVVSGARASANATVAPDPEAHTVLPSVAPPAPEIIVAASRYELTNSLTATLRSFSATDLTGLPDLGDDALRAAARVPGTASNGLNARVNVRGGDVSETLVRFDGVRLYNPFHLKDFQSLCGAIDPSIVGSLEVYTGGFAARYGDRLSAVLDISSLAPPAPRYREVSLSFFNASALDTGRFAGERGEWLVSARRSNLDVWYHALSTLPGTPGYVDGFAKAAYRASDALRVTAGMLYFADVISIAIDDGDEQASADYKDRYFWVRLDHDPTPQLSGATIVAHAQLGSNRAGSTDKEGVSHGALSDSRAFSIDSLQTDWTWRAGSNVRFQFGGELRHARGRYDYHDQAMFDVMFDIPGAPAGRDRDHEIAVRATRNPYALYASVRLGPARGFMVDVGARVEDRRLGPRLGFRQRIGEHSWLYGSWGRLYQSESINELQVADGATRFSRPQRADEAAVGFEQRFARGIELRLEAYDKRLGALPPRYENLLDPLTLVPELKPDRIGVLPTRGRARGVEVLLSRRGDGPLRWWLSYSRSTAQERIDGGFAARGWDQPNALSAGLDWSAGRWKISAAFLQRSGWPATDIALANDPAPDDASVAIVHASPYHSARMRRFRSLDARVERRLALDHSVLTTFLEVQNVLGRKNPCCTAYEIDDEEGGLELQRRNYLPRLPALGVLLQF
jgi:hypothetical protein